MNTSFKIRDRVIMVTNGSMAGTVVEIRNFRGIVMIVVEWDNDRISMVPAHNLAQVSNETVR